jgi:hypothetical protein
MDRLKTPCSGELLSVRGEQLIFNEKIKLSSLEGVLKGIINYLFLAPV